jgi:methylated-DNA-[protein]-cysteine S-methyltransferase
MSYCHLNMKSPIGLLTCIAKNNNLVAVLMENENPHRVKIKSQKQESNHLILLEAKKQLTEYFENKRTQFNLSLEFEGTEFQKEVWHSLLTIPYGKTFSYLDIAKTIDKPKASRAVGMAIGKNPLSIIVPCHRVIGSNGKLTGFAGGLHHKAFLLNLEGDSGL